MSEAQKGFWSQIVEFIKPYLTKTYLKQLAPLFLKSIGVKASGFYIWLTTVGLKKFVNWAYPWIVKFTYLWDRSAINKKNEKKLEENKTNGATSDEKVKDELDFLNGTDTKP